MGYLYVISDWLSHCSYDEQEALDLLIGAFEERTVKIGARSIELNGSDAPQHKGLDFLVM